MLEIFIIVVSCLVLGVAAISGFAALKFRSLRARHRRRIAAVEPEHSEPASLVGIASEGKAQSRGLGTLAIGPTHLVFVQLAPERDILVARSTITSVRPTQHFLGKTTNSPLLVITWDVDGLSDAMAVAVPDVGAWIGRLA